jgi:hypothetical protein
MPSGDTAERQENKRDLAIDQFPAGRNEAPGPDEVVYFEQPFLMTRFILLQKPGL